MSARRISSSAVSNAAGQAGRFLNAADRTDQQRELVAAESRQHRIRADHSGSAFGESDQDLVAHRVAVYVVDRLEAVEVDHHQGEPAAVPPQPVESRRHAVLELAAIGKAGERIGEGEVLGAILGALAGVNLASLILESPDTEDDQADDAEQHDDDDLVDLRTFVLLGEFVEALEQVEVAGQPEEDRQRRNDDGDVDERPPLVLQRRCHVPPREDAESHGSFHEVAWQSSCNPVNEAGIAAVSGFS
jgi:hypothetical protein